MAVINPGIRVLSCGCLFNTGNDYGKEKLREHIRTCEKSPLVKTIIAAESLVVHMWVHSTYKNNGYLQMTTEQKVMYCAAIGAKFDPVEPKFEEQPSKPETTAKLCQCRACIRASGEMVGGFPKELTMMIVCDICGNKRCPHANHHKFECTNSNEPATPADLSETSLEAAVIQIAAWTDERGLLIAAKPRKLVVAPSNMFVATRILETELRVATADNDINALKSNGSIPEGYTVNHFLTDPDAWFLTTDVPNGLKHFVRTPMATSMDGDFDTGNVRYKARERYSFGWSDPLGVFGSPGA